MSVSPGMRRLTALAAVALCQPAAGTVARAQEARAAMGVLRVGDRVRLSARTLATPPVLAGTVVRLASDSLALSYRGGGGPLTLALSDLTSVEVSRGRPGYGRRTLLGAVTGLTIGAVVVGGIAWAYEPPQPVFVTAAGDRGFSARRRTPDRALVGAAIGGLVGTLVGGAIGERRSPEMWTRVPWPTPAGGR